MNDLEYIKKFSKITVKNICESLKVDSSNLWAGRTSAAKTKLIRKALEAELAKLVIEDYENVKQEERPLQSR